MVVISIINSIAPCIMPQLQAVVSKSTCGQKSPILQVERKTIALLPQDFHAFFLRFLKMFSSFHHTPRQRIQIQLRELQGRTDKLLLVNEAL